MLITCHWKQTSIYSHCRVVQTIKNSFPKKAALGDSHQAHALGGCRDMAAGRAESGCVAYPAWVRTNSTPPSRRGRPAAAQTRCRARAHEQTEACTDLSPVLTFALSTAQFSVLREGTPSCQYCALGFRVLWGNAVAQHQESLTAKKRCLLNV